MKKWPFLVLISFLLANWAPNSLAGDGVVFIVNSDNPVSTISVVDIKEYFFKRKREWPDGSSIRFIDRSPNSPDRDLFLRKILKKSSDEVDLYWVGQKLYTGDSAPLTAGSDSMTIQFVSAFKGAIGYISASAVFNTEKVKKLTVLGISTK